MVPRFGAKNVNTMLPACCCWCAPIVAGVAGVACAADAAAAAVAVRT